MSGYTDYTVFTMYMTLGIPLIASYYLLTTRSSKVLNDFWSNRGQVKWLKSTDKRSLLARRGYKLSMLIAAAFGVYLLYYFTWGNGGYGVEGRQQQNRIFGLTYEEGGKYFIYVSFLLFLGFSLLWIPSFRLEARLSSIVLFTVGAGAVLLTASLASTSLESDEDKAALAAAVYLAFHTCVLDGLLWTGTVKLD